MARNSFLRAFIILTAAYGGASLIAPWLYQEYYIHLNIPDSGLGWLMAGYFIAGSIGSHIGGSLTPAPSVKIVLFVLFASCFLWAGASLLNGFWIIPGFFALYVFANLQGPLIRDIINSGIDSSYRAFALSFCSLLSRIFYTGYGLGTGYIVGQYGIQVGLLSLAVLCALFSVWPALGVIRGMPNCSGTCKEFQSKDAKEH